MRPRTDSTIALVIAAVLLALAVAPLALAQVNNITQATSHATIQGAINAAVNGDVIEADPGTYVENITFGGRAITLRSASGNPADTIIDGGGAGSVVTCNSGEGPDTVLEGFTITNGNSAAFGGGMNIVGSSPTVTNCVFAGNSSAFFGGGMHNELGSPTVTNCSFIGNSAGTVGGGMSNSNSGNPTVINCSFTGNSAVNGGGMYNNQSSPTVTNCSFSGNTATNLGDGMYNFNNGNPTVTNCILWANTTTQMVNSTASPTVSHCDIQGGLPAGAIDAGGNIDADPLFADPDGPDNILGTPDDDLRLQAGSPAINAGDDSAVTEPTDLDGNTRIIGCIVDMGAYEVQAMSGTVSNLTQATFYCTIQAAIDAAVNGDIIEVLPGTYVENINFLGKAITLASASGNPADTIIDRAGALPVVVCVTGEGPDTVLDGFTITGAGIPGTGMYNYLTSPTVNNCAFSGHSADLSGVGAMVNVGGSPTVTNCSFTGNVGPGMNNQESNPTVTNCSFSASSGLSGYGMANEQSSPTVAACSFTGNEAGGMYNHSLSSPTVTDCSFSGNFGPGMYNQESNPTVTSCSFSGNSGSVSGGIVNDQSSPTVTNCSFSGNTATGVQGSGAMVNANNSSPTVTNCSFSGNSGSSSGGMYNSQSSPTVTNCSFSGNTATGADGGGAMLNVLSSATVTNCSFSGNIATGGGLVVGAMLNSQSNPTVTNCILWANTPNQMFNDATSSPAVSYCDIQGGVGAITGAIDAGGNIDADPFFVDPDGPDDILGTPDDDLRLVSVPVASPANSPCIDAGDNTAPGLAGPPPITTDLDANPRFRDSPLIIDTGNGAPPVVDMGAYEDQSPNLPYLEVPTDAPTIQAALFAIIDDPGSLIEVLPGTYVENIDLLGKAVTLASASGDPADTIIAAAAAGSVVTCASGEGPDTVLNGFTITGGNANGPFPDNVGGGMNNIAASPTVNNCWFIGNSAAAGGGMYTQDANPTVTNCAFLGNDAFEGGGMYNDGGSPKVTNCSFSGNFSDLGAGMCNFISTATVTNCSFSGNWASDAGGMYTVGGGPTVTNSILWDNVPDQMFNFQGPTVSYCDIQGGLPPDTIDAGNNIDADPLFADPDGADNTLGTPDDDLRLSPNSPCIDAGDNAAPALAGPPAITTDLDGAPRFHDDTGTPDTGSGAAPIIDMGPYEFQGTSPPLCPCPGDIDGDCDTDVFDFGILAASFGQTVTPFTNGDLDDDGIVTIFDFAIFASDFTCGLTP